MTISIHAPTRGATQSVLPIVVQILFQSTLPREERQSNHQSGALDHDFNPRSHERSDGRRCQKCPITHDFNPRSHERSDSSSLPDNAGHTNFNPRSHERSDVYGWVDTKDIGISIHAPTRGATMVDQIPYIDKVISIHAPTRGATVVVLPLVLNVFLFQSTLPREERHPELEHRGDQKEFQSTLPREERRETKWQDEIVDSISIHAPTRGATQTVRGRHAQHVDFNPRSHERSD